MEKEMIDLLIRNTDYLDKDWEYVRGKDIAVRDGVILEVGPGGSLDGKYEAKEEIDGKDTVFLPGLVDAHMHTGQQLLRGGVLDEMPMIWKRIMLPFESTLTEEKMRLSAGLAALDMIRSGTCGFIEAGSYFMDEAAKVYEESGLRGVLSYSTMDQKGLPDSISMDAREAIRRTDELFDAWDGRGNLKVYYSLRALISCSEELIDMANERAKEKDTFLQAHMNEYPGEIQPYMERYKKRPYEYLESRGVLGRQFLGAHSLLLSEREKEIIKERGVKICHCPFSNCGKAVPDTPKLVNMGILPGIGTDGAAHGGLSIWNEMRIFRSVMNVYHGVPLAEPAVMPAKTVLSMATEGGAACMGLENAAIGEGNRADLIGIDMDAPHLWISGQISNTLLESVEAGDVKHTVTGGKILMKNREILTLDEEKIRFLAREYKRKERI
ncbi:MAG: amidohydrolase family protein [Sellimonas sp.]|uniref:amidohydrolase family protein n=2 Tax=Sellimonas sp. TaxID=2021466 RepID=UPI00399F7465